jgi:hypothetical protein
MRLIYGFASISLLAACGTDVAGDDMPPPTAARATWYQDVAPIVSAHCMSCHQDGGIAPFSLTSYEDARDNAPRMLDQVNMGSMPPWGAQEQNDCTPRFNWKDDPRLSAQEKLTLQWWLDDGAQEGIKADVKLPPNTDLTNVTVSMAPSQAFVTAGAQDQFICTVLDPQLAVGAWMTGMQIVPGNALVVHHAVISEVVPSSAQMAIANTHTAGVPWDCSHEQQPADLVLGIWTPGNQPLETPPELAVPLLAGSKVVMQLHYHPANAVNDPDITSIKLRTSSQWPQKMYFVAAFGNATTAPSLLPDPDDRDVTTPEFRIPANSADHTEHMRFVVPDLAGAGLHNAQFYSVNPHMHLIGTHINGTIFRPQARGNDPQAECLANGSWNFDWQRTYIYDTPIAQMPSVQKDDVIDIQCHWNSTMDNPFEQRALRDAHLGAPVDVTLGEGNSTDEMCLEIFGISVDAPPPPAAARTLTADMLPVAGLQMLMNR